MASLQSSLAGPIMLNISPPDTVNISFLIDIISGVRSRSSEVEILVNKTTS